MILSYNDLNEWTNERMHELINELFNWLINLFSFRSGNTIAIYALNQIMSSFYQISIWCSKVVWSDLINYNHCVCEITKGDDTKWYLWWSKYNYIEHDTISNWDSIWYAIYYLYWIPSGLKAQHCNHMDRMGTHINIGVRLVHSFDSWV